MQKKTKKTVLLHSGAILERQIGYYQNEIGL